ncbi:MAG: hypothetical protein WCO06_00565 [Candidatus Roizmanbacteria bacterium]
MKNKWVYAWIVISIVVPMIIGSVLIFSPYLFFTKEITASALAGTMGLRNIAISIVLILALYNKNYGVIIYILMLRGLTEVADGLSIVISGQSGNVIPAFVLAGVSFFVAYTMQKTLKK